LADCLYDLGIQIELSTDLGRPVSFPSFCYMDSVIQFGSQETRLKLGSSLDLYDNADCALIARTKMEALNDSPQRPAIMEALRQFRTCAEGSLDTLKSLRHEVKRHADSFELLLWTAAFKVHACARLIALIESDEENLKAALREMEHLRSEMKKAFSFCLPPSEIAREDRYLFEGERELFKSPTSMFQTLQ